MIATPLFIKSNNPQHLLKSNDQINTQSNTMNTVENNGLDLDLATRAFNTALISSRSGQASVDSSIELKQLLTSQEFRAILLSVRTLMLETGMLEKEAAEKIVQTFRRLDQIWMDYLIKEGIESLKNQNLSS